MILAGFGIKLIRLTENEIELVRQKRNSPEISRFMEYREEITPSMQEKWFRSIDNEFNNYFLINFKGENIGLVYGSAIDWEKNETGNGGIFIWNTSFRETPVPLAASLLLTDTSFILGLEKTYIKVLKDNLPAIAFDLNLGYRILPDQENVMNQRYVLEEENYVKKTQRFRNSFEKMYGDTIAVTITDRNHPMSVRILERLFQISPERKKRIELILP